jgi:hypothetical protein
MEYNSIAISQLFSLIDFLFSGLGVRTIDLELPTDPLSVAFQLKNMNSQKLLQRASFYLLKTLLQAPV